MPDHNAECLVQLMRGLEIPPGAADVGPEHLFRVGQAIAQQAKKSADVSPQTYKPAKELDAETLIETSHRIYARFIAYGADIDFQRAQEYKAELRRRLRQNGV